MRMDQATHKAVGKIALSFEGVEETLYFGGPAFKVNGHLLACPAGHPSADMNSLLVPMPFDQRDELLAADPDSEAGVEHPRGVDRTRQGASPYRDRLRLPWFSGSRGG